MACDIPISKISGSHFQIGVAVGQLQKEHITTKFAEKDGSYRSILKPFYETNYGRHACEELFANTSNLFPQFMDEIKGIASGVGVDPMSIFLLNAELEITMLRDNRKSSEGCTTFFVNDTYEQLLIHNEDVTPVKCGRDWLIQPHITSDSSLIKEETYLAYSQPGWLAGRNFGVNHHGLVLTSNILFPTYMNTKGVPRSVIDRAILSAVDFDDVMKMVNLGKGIVSGDSANIAQNVDGTISMANLELYGSPFGTVADYKLCSPGNTLIHTNEYERLKVDSLPDISSKHRVTRIQELIQHNGVPKCKNDVFKILGDDKNKEYPVYRSGADPDYLATAYTACFDLNSKQLEIIKGNPKAPEATRIVDFESLKSKIPNGH